jgi:Fur family ferric uptake transcriptional regulator
MTAEDVFRVLLEERSDIGLATVYRVLTQFEQAGILIRSNFESGKAVYELNEGPAPRPLSCARRAARWKSSTTPRSKSASS